MIRLDVSESTNFEITLRATPSRGKWPCRLLIGRGDPASPQLKDGGVKNAFSNSFFQSERLFSFPLSPVLEIG